MERNSVKKWIFTELAQLLWSLWRPLHSTLIIFLFRGMVRNGIPRVCFNFCSTERNSELVFFPLKSSEGNFESLLQVWYHGTEFRVVFSFAEGFGRQLWEFACIFVQRNGIPNCFLFRGRVLNGIPRVSVPRNSRNFVGNNHFSVYSVFRIIIFLSEIPNPMWAYLRCPLSTTEGTYQPLQRGFFRVHTFVWREREPDPEFLNF
jgi:hypothetical protein